MTNTNQQPAATLRDGAIKATIWANSTEQGRIRYSINIIRSYTDQEGKWHDTHYFGKQELLRVAKLAEKAYDTISQLTSGNFDEEASE